ncbi:UNVERIFIED_CONTAM: hypothetical protein GTU68_003124 [Idotea baltica]|nr:hypothetical protein [Idotea baltica]
MTALIFWIGVFILTLVFLTKSSDIFIDAAEAIGLHFGIPQVIIGITIVALGTSLPELASSIAAVYKGSSEIVVSNVIGSNITNILLVLGIVAVWVGDMRYETDFTTEDVALMFGSVFLLALCISDYHFSKIEAFLCLVCLFIYLGYNLKQFGGNKDEDKESNHSKLPLKVWFQLLLGGVGVYLSASFNVESIIKIAEELHIGKEYIALGAVSLGTSLPELFVSLAAVKKGKIEMALGNILGSNIFNICAVMGVTGLLGDLIIPEVVLKFSLPLMIIATFLYFFITRDKKVSRWEGLLLLTFYVYFIYSLFENGLVG